MSIESAIAALAPIVNSIISIFDKHDSKFDAISQDFKKEMMGEHIMGPLVDMHSSLSKAELGLDIYITLLANASGQFKDILVRNQSNYFFNLVQVQLNRFKNELERLEQIGNNGGKQIIQSINGNACSSALQYEQNIHSQEQYISNITNAGAQLTVNDVMTLINNYKAFIACYFQGLNRSFIDLAHIK